VEPEPPLQTMDKEFTKALTVGRPIQSAQPAA
jgi:hypothetical protein